MIPYGWVPQVGHFVRHRVTGGLGRIVAITLDSISIELLSGGIEGQPMPVETYSYSDFQRFEQAKELPMETNEPTKNTDVRKGSVWEDCNGLKVVVNYVFGEGTLVDVTIIGEIIPESRKKLDMAMDMFLTRFKLLEIEEKAEDGRVPEVGDRVRLRGPGRKGFVTLTDNMTVRVAWEDSEGPVASNYHKRYFNAYFDYMNEMKAAETKVEPTANHVKESAPSIEESAKRIADALDRIGDALETIQATIWQK